MDSGHDFAKAVAVLQRILSDQKLPVSRLNSSDTLTQPLRILPRDIPTSSELDSNLLVTPFAAAERPAQGRGQAQGQEQGGSLSALADHLVNGILPYLNLGSLSPNYYGFVTGGATPAALVGDWLAAVYDQNAAVHLPRETLATTLEVHTLNLLTRLFRLPDQDWRIGDAGPGGGCFTTGATASNVLGMALGREFVLRAALEKTEPAADREPWSCGEWGMAELMRRAGVRNIQILSTLPHSSIFKAAGVVGIGRRNVVSVAADGDPLAIDFGRLEREARRDDVLSILAVSTGEVNTGHFATDSLATMARLRQICDAHGMWLHVDGAFGLFGRILPRDDPEHQDIVRGVDGIELADSITSDCHKLLNVPYDCGVFFTRHKAFSEHVFQNGKAAYLTSALDTVDHVQSPLNIGIENSRRFRALPVYCTLVTYGQQGYVDMLTRQIALARRVTRWLLHDPRFEVLPRQPARPDHDDLVVAKTFIIVLFRLTNDERNRDFVRRVDETGRIYLSGTSWDGRPAARIAVSSWQVDVQRDGDLIEDVLHRAAEEEVTS